MKKRMLLFFSTFAFTVLLMSFLSVTSSASDRWEYEPNDDFDTYNLTLEDNNNYGYISSKEDFDCWKTFFAKSGYANFWIGNIPSGCNYVLYVVDEDASVILGESTKYMAKQQLVTIPVEFNKYYYVCIYTTEGYSTTQPYTMRAFGYPDHTISSVPLYKQQSDSTCNAACGRMILASYGIYVSEDDFKNTANTLGQGSGMNYQYVGAIKMAINHYLSANNKSTTFLYSCTDSITEADLKSLVAHNIKKGQPMIELIKPTSDSTFGYSSNGHYVVIKGTKHDSSANYYAVVNDPNPSYCKTLNVKMSEMRSLLRNHSSGGHLIYVYAR